MGTALFRILQGCLELLSGDTLAKLNAGSVVVEARVHCRSGRGSARSVYEKGENSGRTDVAELLVRLKVRVEVGEGNDANVDVLPLIEMRRRLFLSLFELNLERCKDHVGFAHAWL